MKAEIEAMTLTHNMHQQSLREKTLIKSYLEVDMNEFFQSQIDSATFADLDEGQKAQFVGNFFHWVKCKFNDCNLLQTKSKINTKEASQSPTAAEMKAIEDKAELDDWGKQGAHTAAYNNLEKHGHVVAYAQTDAKNKNTNKNANKLNGKNKINTKAVAKGKSPTAAESKQRYDKLNLDDWGKQGNATSNFHGPDKEYVQTKADVNADKHQRLASDQFPAVQKALAKEKADELVKPTAPAENNKDTEPGK
jgi:hypothetical protein